MKTQVATKANEMLKPNPDIGFRITSGRMTFLSRKIYNCFVYRAQLVGVAGKGTLPFPVAWSMADHDINQDDYWWIPMSDLVDDVASEVGDKGRIRAYLRDLMSVLVERTTSGWEIQHIIESARIINTAGPEIGRQGGKLMVGWSFPKALEKKILTPDEYTRMCLYFQGRFKTESALVLYEICKQYATSPGNLTPRLPWEDWHARMTGNSIGETIYKNFSRRTLKPAIKEVNDVKDIFITIVEHKKAGTKAIELLQFVVEQKPQGSLELSEPVIDTQMLQAMESIGISPNVAEKLLIEHGENKVKATLAYTNERLAQSKLPPIAAPGAYFKKALAEDYAAGAAKGKQAKETAKAAKAKLIDDDVQSRKEAMLNKSKIGMGESANQQVIESKIRANAKAAFDEMDPETRRKIEEEYCNAIAPKLAKDARTMFGAPGWTTGQATAKLFLVWLAEKLGN